jgi:Putative MetA-pathway of phenol degradation
MRSLFKLALSAVVALCSWQFLGAQDLSPRAYIITAVHSNAVTLTYSFYDGGLNFNGTIPVTGATGTYSVPIATIYHSFNFFGRSANFNASLPYGVGTFQGKVLGTDKQIYRSGLLDFTARLSVNLKGGPAMAPKEFAKWHQKMLLGASLRIVAPTGQYDATKLVNWSINRWAFKPEFGYSERWGHWILDGYAGVWFYTTNSAFYSPPVPKPQTEAPIGSFEAHLSYDFPKERMWASLDGNFWFGGITALSGIRNLATKQTASRIGGTISVPITKHQSLKASYSDGTYVRFGGDYQNVSVAWQYSWIGRRLK